MAEILFLLLGILIGICLISVIALFLYHQSCPDYVERETGTIWHLKTVAWDECSNKTVYVMQSTKTAEVLAMSMQDLKNRFKL